MRQGCVAGRGAAIPGRGQQLASTGDQVCLPTHLSHGLSIRSFGRRKRHALRYTRRACVLFRSAGRSSSAWCACGKVSTRRLVGHCEVASTTKYSSTMILFFQVLSYFAVLRAARGGKADTRAGPSEASPHAQAESCQCRHLPSGLSLGEKRQRLMAMWKNASPAERNAVQAQLGAEHEA